MALAELQALRLEVQNSKAQFCGLSTSLKNGRNIAEPLKTATWPGFLDDSTCETWKNCGLSEKGVGYPEISYFPIRKLVQKPLSVPTGHVKPAI
jgi:hypothetical protein